MGMVIPIPHGNLQITNYSGKYRAIFPCVVILPRRALIFTAYYHIPASNQPFASTEVSLFSFHFALFYLPTTQWCKYHTHRDHYYY